MIIGGSSDMYVFGGSSAETFYRFHNDLWSIRFLEGGGCNSGQYRPVGYTGPCITCPSGATCTQKSFQCLPGMTLNANGNGCSACASGLVKQVIGNQPCSVCPAGTEPDSTMTNCVSC